MHQVILLDNFAAVNLKNDINMGSLKPILTSLLVGIGLHSSAYSQTIDVAPGLATRAADSSLIDYTYYQGESCSYTGYDEKGRQSAAIAIDPSAIKGMKITSIYAVGLKDSSDFGNLRFWGSTELNHNHDLIESDTEASIVDGRAETFLETEFIIPDTPFYIGYDIDTYTDTGSFLPFANGNPVPGGVFITYGTYPFDDYSGFMGPLTIGMTLKPEQPLAENSLLLLDYGASVVVQPGETINVMVKAVNNGLTPIERFAYMYEVGDLSHYMDIELNEPIQPNIAFSTPLALSLDPIMEEGEYNISLYASDVNGVENPSKNSVVNLKVIVSLPPDSSVLEGTTPFAYTSEPPNSWFSAYGGECVYDIGMKIQSPEFVGMEVVGARVSGLTRTNGVGNFKGWLTSILGDNFDIETVITGMPDETGDLLIIFKNPYKLGEEGVYIGYSCEVLELTQESINCIPLYSTYEEGKFTNGCFINFGTGWNDEGYWNGCATTITAYLRGELPSDNVSIGNMRSHSVIEKNVPYTLSFEICNNGNNDVKSIEYTYNVLGEERSQTLTLPEPLTPAIGINSLVDLEFTGLSDVGSYPMKVSVTKVNGNDNTANEISTECTINVIDYKVPHRVLMEEATGTWCGYCPRGWLAMREMTDRYPEFIGLAYHNGDPMAVGEIPFDNAGFPYASLDRTVNTDPFYGTNKTDLGIENDWLAMREQLTLADINIAAEWNEEQTSINVTSEVKFVLPIENADYKIGYVLVGNGYTDPSKAQWMQKNYYSGTTQTGLLEELSELPPMIPTMVYDDVVICSDYASGVPESLPTSIKTNETYIHTQTFHTLSIIGEQGDELIQDKKNIEVVAFIINPEGKIVNSNKTTPTLSAIEKINADASVVEQTYYSLNGIIVKNPAPGIYIVKELMSDGRVIVRKVCLK